MARIPEVKEEEIISIYEEMDQKGKDKLRALATRGEFKAREFKGTGFSTVVGFDNSSERQIDALVDRIAEIAQSHQIKLSLAGIRNGVPPHCTLLDGKLAVSDEFPERAEIAIGDGGVLYEHKAKNRRLGVYQSLGEDERLNPLLQSFDAAPIVFNRLILTQNFDILLATSRPPQAVLQARADLADIYKAHDLDETTFKPTDPILFMTLGRMKVPPADKTKKNIDGYVADLETLQRELAMTPLSLTASAEDSYYDHARAFLPVDMVPELSTASYYRFSP